MCRRSVDRRLAHIYRRRTAPASTAAEFRDLISQVDPEAFRDAPQGQIRADPDRRGQPAAAAWDMSTTTAT